MLKKNNNFVNGESTVIGAGTVVEGNLKAAMSARIDGIVNGDVSSEGTIVVANDGVVNGNITASDVKISGVVNGNVKALEKIELIARGKLIGDIKTKSLNISDTAVFHGNCNMQEDAAVAVTNETQTAAVATEASEDKTEDEKTEE